MWKPDTPTLAHHLKQERLYVASEKQLIQRLNHDVLKTAEKLYRAAWIAKQQRINLDRLILTRYTLMHTHTPTRARTYTRARAHTHTHTRAHTYTHTRALRHAHTGTHTQARTHRHTHTTTHTHTHTHTHAHTRENHYT